MTDAPFRNKLLLVRWICALAALAVFYSPLRAEPWPIKQFEVVYQADDVSEFLQSLPTDESTFLGSVFRPVVPYPELPELIEWIEQTLSQSAEIYEADGFMPPHLQPVVTGKNGQPAYQIYLVEEIQGVEAAGIYHFAPCDSFIRVRDEYEIFLNINSISNDGRFNLTKNGVQTVAHELFHAVQFGAPFFQGCDTGNVGSWITEGSARAAGWIVAQNIWPLEIDVLLSVSPQSRSNVWGHRNYSIALPIPFRLDIHPQPDVAYNTSSFWRYLAEYDGSNGLPDSPGRNPMSLSYLAKLFNSPPVERDCVGSNALCKGELEWIDGYSRVVFGKPLREIYARFVQAYSLYGSERMDDLESPANTSPKWDPEWLHGGFTDSGCTHVELDWLNYRETYHITSFAPISARCWTVGIREFYGSSVPVAIVLEMRSGNQVPILTQFTLSLSDGVYSLAKAKLDNAAGEMQRVRWEYDFPVLETAPPEQLEPPEQGIIVLLSNVADDAEYTAAFSERDGLEITFTALREYASMGPSTAVSNDIIDAINTPLEIEFSQYSVRVHPLEYEKVGDSFVGKGGGEGLSSPCSIWIQAALPGPPGTGPGDYLSIMMRTEGPITPGHYPVAPYVGGGVIQSHVPPSMPGAGVLLQNMPQNHHKLNFESGYLTIESIDRELVVGHISGVAHARDAYSNPPYQIVESRTLTAKFSIRLRRPNGIYREFDYPCIDSSR